MSDNLNDQFLPYYLLESFFTCDKMDEQPYLKEKTALINCSNEDLLKVCKQFIKEEFSYVERTHEKYGIQFSKITHHFLINGTPVASVNASAYENHKNSFRDFYSHKIKEYLMNQ